MKQCDTAVAPDQTLSELAEECKAAYELLIEALPLALTALELCEVKPDDQRCFWSAVERLSGFCDVFDDDCDLDSDLTVRADALAHLAHIVRQDGC